LPPIKPETDEVAETDRAEVDANPDAPAPRDDAGPTSATAVSPVAPEPPADPAEPAPAEGEAPAATAGDAPASTEEAASAPTPPPEPPSPEPQSPEPQSPEPPAASKPTPAQADEPASDTSFARLAQGVVGLAAVGASIGGLIVELRYRTHLDTLLAKNELEVRKTLIRAILGGGAGLVVAALVFYGIARLLKWRAPAERVHRVGMFLLPLGVVMFIPLIFRKTSWKQYELLSLIAALGLLFEPLVRASLANVPALLTRGFDWLRRRTPKWIDHVPLATVLAASLGYIFFASYFTILHHQRLGSACYDLGLYDNLFYNASIGNPFRMTALSGEEDWASLKGHAELGIYALLPFYFLKRGPESLLVLQAALLGSAAIPLYLLGTRFISRWSAMILALAYILFGPMHRANFYDFHMQPIAAGYLMWMMYFLVSKRTVLFWIFFTLGLTTREDISVGLACFGIFLMLVGYRPRVGLFITVIGAMYFVVLKFLVMPRFGTWWFANMYKDLAADGTQGYGPVVETLISNPAFVFKTLLTPEKLAYVLHIMAPLAFLPFRRRYLAMAILPGFAFTLLTSGYKHTVSIDFQYSSYYFPYIFPAAVVALRAIGGQPANPDLPADPPTPEGLRRRRAALAAVCFLSVAFSYHYGALIKRDEFKSGFSRIEFKMKDTERERYRDLVAIKQHIPRDASVAATEHIAPHISARASFYCFRKSIGPADYVLVGPVDKSSDNRKTLKQMMNSKKLGVVAEQGGFVLLQKGADTSKNQSVITRL
jgi:uncharacterized membrane protein